MPDFTTGLNMKTTLYIHLIYIAAATLIVSAGLTGCLSANGSSSAREHGQNIWEAFCAESGKEANTAFIQALDRVAQELIKVIPDAGLREQPWELEIFASPFPYAFCLPGGKLAVSTGAFNFARDDAELAALTARAIAHMLHGHGEKRYKEFIAAGTQPSLDELMKIYGAGDASSGIPRFSENFEIIADREGMMLMAQAGYFPAAMPALLRKLYGVDYVDTVKTIIRDNSLSGRFAEVDRLLPEAQKLYEAAPQQHGTGQVYDPSMRYSDAIADDAPDQLLRMEDSAYEINYPSNWTVSRDNALLSLTAFDRAARISIIDVPTDSFASTDALRDMLADKLPSVIPDAQVSKKGFSFINRRRSPELESSFSLNGNEWRQWTVVYSRQDGKRIHVFSFYALKDQYDSRLLTAKAILNSLKPVNIPVATITASATETPAQGVAPSEEAMKIRMEVNREIEVKRVMLRNKINEYDSMCLQEGLKNNLQNRRCPRCKNIIVYDKGKFRWACRRCRHVIAEYGNIPLNTGKTINQEIASRKQQLNDDIKRLQEQGNERLKNINQPPQWGPDAVKTPQQPTATRPLIPPARALPLVDIPTAAASERSERIEQTKAEAAIPVGARAVHSLVEAQIEKAGYDGAEDFGANAAALLHGRELHKDLQCPDCKSTTGYDFGTYYWICPECKKKVADLIDTPYENTTIRLYIIDRETKAVTEIKELRKQGNIQLRRLGQEPLWEEHAPVKNVSDHSRRPELKP